MMNKEIIFLEPVFTHNIWGGQRLSKDFGYNVKGTDIGECWGISAHPSGDCTVVGGSFAGQKLSEVYRNNGDLFGNIESDRFPLLIKIIDANDDLSIQVHPDDAYAGANENGSLGKTECWYIIDCPENATLVVGHNAKTHEELADMIHGGRWNDFIRKIPIKKGDFIQIDPGTVHAITAGCLILETQQSSDITYRVYDYDRLQNGKPREIHVEKSIDVISVPAKSAEDSLLHTEDHAESNVETLIENDFYCVMKCEVRGTLNMSCEDSFANVSVIEGEGSINGTAIKKGSHFIVPAGFGEMQFAGDMMMIISTL